MPADRPIPQSGERWKHYKGETYQIISVGHHTETGERLVSYVRVGGEKVWFRPLKMFMSAIGDGKTLRFERVAFSNVIPFTRKPRILRPVTTG